jgi:SAM-dependent methyltransferase
MIPLLRKWGIDLHGLRVIDVGCGEGGGVCAMHDGGADVVGFDLQEHRVESARELSEDRKITFQVGDLYASEQQFPVGQFDLVVLHDVFEHLDRKPEMLSKLMSFANEHGSVMITFPPYYSGFGAHQQLLKTRWAKLPFIHLVPGFLSTILPNLKNEHPPVVEEIEKLGRLKMGMKGFEEIVESVGCEVARLESYIISPNHIRFGLRPLSAGPLGRISGLREVTCSGVVYLIRRRTGS